MTSNIAQLIQLGNDITSTKYYGIAASTVFFYEYFAMLPDEIQYAWSSNKTWVFYLFLLNRYFPMAFQFWVLKMWYQQSFSQEMCDYVLPPTLSQMSDFLTYRCDRTSFIGIFSFAICTLTAQVVLTLRVYAVTGRSKLVAFIFATITISQITIGIYQTFLTAMNPAEIPPDLPFDSFRLCFFSRHKKNEIAFTVISLGYDFLLFSVMVYIAGRSAFRQYGVPGLLGTILRDATVYFFMIFSANFVIAMTLLFTRPSIQLLPGTGILAFLPVMITRLMISLRKAARSQGLPWSMGESTVGRETFSIQFAHPPDGSWVDGRQPSVDSVDSV